MRLYLDQNLRGEPYFDMLLALRGSTGFYDSNHPRYNELVGDPTSPPPGQASRTPAPYLTRFRNRLQARAIEAIRDNTGLWVIDWCAPRLKASLADYEVMLLTEMNYRAQRAWYTARQTLYGHDTLPELTESVQRRAEQHFREWLVYNDALAECHVFDLLQKEKEGTPSQLTEGEKSHVQQAADLFALAGRRCLEPTLRRLSGGREMYWHSNDDPDARVRVAIHFIKQEIRCLSLLCGIEQQPPSAYHDERRLRGILTETGAVTVADQILRCRIIFAHLHLESLNNRVSDARKPDSDQRPIWNFVNQQLQPIVVRFLHDNKTNLEQVPFELNCRERFFDAATYCQQPKFLIDQIVEDNSYWKGVVESDKVSLETKAEARRRQARDNWIRGRVQFVQAQQATQSAGVDVYLFLEGIKAFERAADPSLRCIPEYTPHSVHDPRVRDALARIKAMKIEATAEPAEPKCRGRELRATQRGEPLVQRRPTFFVLACRPMHAANNANT
jgi:hypothetical protein